MKTLPLYLLCFFCAAFLAAGLNASITVEAKKTTDTAEEWVAYPTKTIADVKSFDPAAGTDDRSRYGGSLHKTFDATGFFHVTKVKLSRGERWFLVDPEGHAFFQVGLCSVSSTGWATYYDTKEAWRDHAIATMRDFGYNSYGCWSEDAFMQAAPEGQKMPYVPVLNVMQKFARDKGLSESGTGHETYAGELYPVFHPDFAAWADAYIQGKVAADVSDPWLLGYYTDNEMPFPPDSLTRALALPDDHFMKTAALAWMDENSIADTSDASNDAFRARMYESYAKICNDALKKYDPNHLNLGNRFNANYWKSSSLMQAAGPHQDVISLNVYQIWTPQAGDFANIITNAGRPVMITEFYAKGVDSGFANTSGAGWLVKTQADRGYFYQNFTLTLLSSPNVVGWTYFKYRDNDPNDPTTDPSNRDSNKGLVQLNFEPWTAMADLMAQINQRAYRLICLYSQESDPHILKWALAATNAGGDWRHNELGYFYDKFFPFVYLQEAQKWIWVWPDNQSAAAFVFYDYAESTWAASSTAWFPWAWYYSPPGGEGWRWMGRQ